MISVITSTYNRADKLKKCIKSVQDQTYQDYEHIIVDDGSKDNTEEVVHSFKDKRIVYIKRPKNFGNDTKPKNAGIMIARGDYVAFLDDDNLFRPDHLQVLLNALEQTPELDGVYGDRYVYVNGKAKGLGISHDYDRMMLFGRNYIDTSDVLIKKEVLFDLGGFDERYKKFIDWNLWLRMAKANVKLKRVPLVITDYHIDKTSKSMRKEDTVDNKPAWNPVDCEVYLDYLEKRTPPKVAIFSLTYDRLEYTKECFKTLHDTAGYKFDHYVVDNRSTDGTRKWLKGNKMFKKVILNAANKGISIASNQALGAIGDDYDIIMKVDNDAFFKDQGWLAKMVEIWKSMPRMALSLYVEGLKDNPGGAQRMDYLTIKDELVGVTKHLGGICHFVDADAYKDFRWDEDSFLHGVQDMEFSQYLGLQGYLMGYMENWRCSHRDGTEGQHKKYKSYFERRKTEKTTKYEKNG